MPNHKYVEVFKKIGGNIKSRRKNLDLTQVQVCELLRCDRRYYQKIEAGQACITIATLQKISLALKTTMADLVRSCDQVLSAPAAMPLNSSEPASD